MVKVRWADRAQDNYEAYGKLMNEIISASGLDVVTGNLPAALEKVRAVCAPSPSEAQEKEKMMTKPEGLCTACSTEPCAEHEPLLRERAKRVLKEMQQINFHGMQSWSERCEWVLVDFLKQAAPAEAGLRALIEKEWPTNWLDPLLTGPTAVIGKPPYGCPDIERLLNALKARILDALLTGGPDGQ
jgi:hypothetical protein